MGKTKAMAKARACIVAKRVANECPYCGQCKQDLEAQIAKFHGFVCECRKRFATAAALANHRAQVHLEVQTGKKRKQTGKEKLAVLESRREIEAWAQRQAEAPQPVPAPVTVCASFPARCACGRQVQAPLDFGAQGMEFRCELLGLTCLGSDDEDL